MGFLSSQEITDEQMSKLTVEGNKNSSSIHSISGEILEFKSIVSTYSAKIQSLNSEMKTLKHRVGILEGVIAKQHIIIRELCDQQTDLINHNMRNHILFHNILADPMENVTPR